MTSQVTYRKLAGRRALVIGSLLILTGLAGAGGAARRRSAPHSAHHRTARRAESKQSERRHGKTKHPVRAAAHGAPAAAQLQPARWHPALDLAFHLSDMRAPGQ
jgi:hypothetical protein